MKIQLLVCCCCCCCFQNYHPKNIYRKPNRTHKYIHTQCCFENRHSGKSLNDQSSHKILVGLFQDRMCHLAYKLSSETDEPCTRSVFRLDECVENLKSHKDSTEHQKAMFTWITYGSSKNILCLKEQPKKYSSILIAQERVVCFFLKKDLFF